MTDEQIIKALECCKIGECEDCPFHGVKEDCEVELPEESLDLINRQKAKIEELKNRNAFLENEYKNQGELFWERVKIKQSEAIKEFAEKLKKRFYLSAGRCVVDVYHIDNLVKEMTEVQE